MVWEQRLTRWQKIYYPCYRFANKFNPKDNYREVKYFIQRGKRGYSDRDTWNVDYYLTKTLPGMLRALADQKHGYPIDWEPRKWEKHLRKAADDIEAHCRFEEEVDFPKTKKAQGKYFKDLKIAQDRTISGMEWVSSHFFNLWD